MGIGIGIGIGRRGKRGVSAVNAAISTWLTAMQASSGWAKVDAATLFAGATPLVNRKNPGTYNATIEGGAVYVDGIGVVGAPAGSPAVNTNFNPATAGGFFQQDSAYIAYRSRSSHPITAGTVIGWFNGTNGTTINARSSVNNNGSYRVNQATASALSGAAITDHVGLKAANRSGASASSFWNDTAAVSDGVDQASTALVSAPIKIFTATGASFATPEMAIGGYIIGGSMSLAEQTAFNNAYDAFYATYDAIMTAYKPEAYSWWADPIAEVQSGRIVVGGAIGPGGGQSGAQCFMEIDELSNIVTRTRRMQDIYPLDDHHVTVSKLLASGKRVAFMTGHGLNDAGAADHTINVAVSSTGRIADFGAIRSITNSLTAVNYGQIHQMGSGRVIIDTNDDGNILWGIIYSDNDFTSETIAKPHVTQAVAPGGGQNQMYEKSVKIAADTLRCFNIPHSSNTQNNIRVAQINTTTGVYSTGATTFGAGIYQAFGAALTDVTNLAAITALAAGRSQRLMDVNSDGTMFVVCEYDNPGGTNATYYLYRLTGANYETAAHWTKSAAIVGAGTPFWASSFYYGGAVFAREPGYSGIRLYLARESAGTNYIERYDSIDNGANWTVTLLKTASVRLLRPVSTGSAVLPVIWQRVTSYTQFDTWSGMSLEWQ